MNPFTRFTSLSVSVAGFLLALYVGGWLCLIGGITNMIQAFHPFIPGLFTLGLVKLLICDVVGFSIFAIGVRLSIWVLGGKIDATTAS